MPRSIDDFPSRAPFNATVSSTKKGGCRCGDQGCRGQGCGGGVSSQVSAYSGAGKTVDELVQRPQFWRSAPPANLPLERLSSQETQGSDSSPPGALIPPTERLASLAAKHGSRRAIELLTGISLRPACTTELADRIVQHFTTNPLLLPWGEMPWWQPIEPDGSSVDRWNTHPRLVIDGERSRKGFAVSRRLPRLASPTRYSLMASVNALCAHIPTSWQASWREYLQKNTWIFDILNQSDLSPAFRQAFGEAVGRLEGFWTPFVSGDATAAEPMLAHANALFAEYDRGGPKFKPRRTLKEADMRIVWARRWAVALWSDRHAHWPWTIADLTADMRDVMLGWHPSTDALVPWSYPGDPSDRDAAPYSSRNGQGINFAFPVKKEKKAGETEHPGFEEGMDDSGFIFEWLWDANPFFNWKVAFFRVRPWMTGATRRDGVHAVTTMLRSSGFTHQYGLPDTDLSNLPKTGVFGSGQYRTWGGGNRGISVEELLKKNNGGCYWVGSIVRGLLRTMNIPCVLGASYTLDSTPADPSKFGSVGGIASEANHHALACPSADANVAVFHSDYITCFKGRRYGSPEMTWVPLAEWHLLNMLPPASVAQVRAKYLFALEVDYFVGIAKRFTKYDDNSEITPIGATGLAAKIVASVSPTKSARGQYRRDLRTRLGIGSDNTPSVVGGPTLIMQESGEFRTVSDVLNDSSSGTEVTAYTLLHADAGKSSGILDRYRVLPTDGEGTGADGKVTKVSEHPHVLFTALIVGKLLREGLS